jgi:fucose 4-O-acetylase-like acetyltransferase
VASFINVWHIPLFFVIAGMSTWFALNRRTAGQYRAERVLRLLVPLVFGVLVRRTNVTRFVFGMKPLAKQPQRRLAPMSFR